MSFLKEYGNEDIPSYVVFNTRWQMDLCTIGLEHSGNDCTDECMIEYVDENMMM